MHLKYKVMFHDQNGQHSYVDLVMCLMVLRSGMHLSDHETSIYILNAYVILVLFFNFLYFLYLTTSAFTDTNTVQ
jgi:hypothetical protein